MNKHANKIGTNHNTSVRITIGICVKNCFDTVIDALESVVTQNYPRKLMEIIVVDGESTDGTLSVVKSYLSKMNIKTLFLSDKGRGLGTARQMVVDKASGKYIIWVDGDIVLPPNYFSKQISFMENNPQVGATRGIERIQPSKQSKVALLEYASKLRYYTEKEKDVLSTFGGVYRTQAIKKIGGFDKLIKGAQEDIDAAIRMNKAGWRLSLNDSEFYPKYKQTWKELFRQYMWYGYGGYYISRKHGDFKSALARIPLFGFFIGLYEIRTVYQVLGFQIAIGLPIYKFLRDIAWWIGYIKGHFNTYCLGIH